MTGSRSPQGLWALAVLVLCASGCMADRGGSTKKEAEACVLGRLGDVSLSAGEVEYIQAELGVGRRAVKPYVAFMELAWQEHERQRLRISLDDGRTSLRQAREQAVRHYRTLRRRGKGAIDLTKPPPSLKLTDCGRKLVDKWRRDAT